jgi:hypothetical protein
MLVFDILKPIMYVEQQGVGGGVMIYAGKGKDGRKLHFNERLLCKSSEKLPGNTTD